MKAILIWVWFFIYYLDFEIEADFIYGQQEDEYALKAKIWTVNHLWKYREKEMEQN